MFNVKRHRYEVQMGMGLFINLLAASGVFL